MIGHPDILRTLRLSRDLSELPDRETFLQAALEILAGMVPCDDIFWVSIDLTQEWAAVRRTDRSDLGSDDILVEYLLDHPSWQTYLAAPDDLLPRRISDCVSSRQWLSSVCYTKVFAETGGEFQLSLVTRLMPPTRGEGWILTRSSSDFSDHDVELAGLLLPLLTVLDRLYPPEPVPVVEARPVPPPPRCALLTPCELQILRLLASGRTAEAIGRATGSSTRTAQKHLQHIYAKIGAHDRLLVVERARHLGLL